MNAGARIESTLLKACFYRCFEIDIELDNDIKRRDASTERPVSGICCTLHCILFSMDGMSYPQSVTHTLHGVQQLEA